MTYALPPGGLPDQSDIILDTAIFKTAYAVIPASVQRDIVTSFFPGWVGTRGWVLARPLTGFAETFSQTIMELAPGGGSDTPEVDPGAEAVIFVVGGQVELSNGAGTHILDAGGYAFLAPGEGYRIWNRGQVPATFHLLRKRYEDAPGIARPESFVTSDQATDPIVMPDCDGVWSTTRFVDPSDLRHDMHVNIVNFGPGGIIPFPETHVMEHGLYVLEGTADYYLNGDWVPVGPGDFMWLRAFCPQCCRVTGDGAFRYLLYKDVNRHPKLHL